MRVKILFVVFSLLFVREAISQEYKEKIKQDFRQYTDLIKNQDFEQAMDYVVPEFFELIPKEKMIETFEMVFNNPEMVIEFKENKINSMEDFKRIEQKYYVKYVYFTVMDMGFKRGEGFTDQEYDQMLEGVKASFVQTFGQENVSYNQEAHVFTLKMTKEGYAVSEKLEADRWLFVNLEKGQEALLGKLLPAQLLE